MDRKFQYTFGFEAHLGNAEGADMFLNINNHVIAVEENQVERVQHTNSVNTV
jgi:hypothetical protein